MPCVVHIQSQTSLLVELFVFHDYLIHRLRPKSTIWPCCTPGGESLLILFWLDIQRTLKCCLSATDLLWLKGDIQGGPKIPEKCLKCAITQLVYEIGLRFLQQTGGFQGWEIKR